VGSGRARVVWSYARLTNRRGARSTGGKPRFRGPEACKSVSKETSLFFRTEIEVSMRVVPSPPSSGLASRRAAAPILAAVLLQTACGGSGSGPTAPPADEPPSRTVTIFSSGFEPEEGPLQSDSTWSNTQIQNPSNAAESFIAFDSTIVRTGTRSLEMFAPQRQFDPLRGEEFCGKASVQNRNFLFREGETYRFSAWFRLTDAPEVANFLMIDVECGESECGFPGGPGIRVMIDRGTDRLIAEWKFLNWFNDLFRPDPPPGIPVRGVHGVPVDEWFEVTLEATFGVGVEGVTRIYVNGVLDSEVVGTNVRPGGVLSTMDRYNSFEIGLTCNIGTKPTTIHLDDVTVERVGA